MFIKSVLLAAFVASASAAPIIKGEPTPPAHTSKLVINKMPAKNITAMFKDVEDKMMKPTWNKTELGKLKVDLLPNITALKGEKEDFIANKLDGLSKDIDVMEKVAKDEVLIVAKPNKTAIILKLDAFKDAVAAQINATIHKKDPKPTPTATIG